MHSLMTVYLTSVYWALTCFLPINRLLADDFCIYELTIIGDRSAKQDNISLHFDISSDFITSNIHDITTKI